MQALQNCCTWTGRTAQALRGLAGESLTETNNIHDQFFNDELRQVASSLHDFDEIADNTHAYIAEGKWTVQLNDPNSAGPHSAGPFEYESAKTRYPSFIKHLDHYVKTFFPNHTTNTVEVFNRMTVNGIVFGSMSYEYFRHLPLVSAVFDERGSPETYFGRVELFARVMAQDSQKAETEITVASVWFVLH